MFIEVKLVATNGAFGNENEIICLNKRDIQSAVPTNYTALCMFVTVLRVKCVTHIETLYIQCPYGEIKNKLIRKGKSQCPPSLRKRILNVFAQNAE